MLYLAGSYVLFRITSSTSDIVFTVYTVHYAYIPPQRFMHAGM